MSNTTIKKKITIFISSFMGGSVGIEGRFSYYENKDFC